MQKWHLIQQQLPLREIFKDLPTVSYKRGRSLTDILVQAQLQDQWVYYTTRIEVVQACHPHCCQRVVKG